MEAFGGESCYTPGDHWNLVIRPANILHVFSQEIYVQWSANPDKNAFQWLKKIFEGNLLFARRTLESGYFPGRIYSMYFLEKYTSNEAQTKIKTLFKFWRTFLSGIKNLKNGPKSLKVNFNPFIFWRNSAIFGTFFTVHFLENTRNWLFARADILHVFFRDIYVQWSSNQDKNAFQGLQKLFEGNLLFALRTLESGYSPERIYFMYFLEKYTFNDAKAK